MGELGGRPQRTTPPPRRAVGAATDGAEKRAADEKRRADTARANARLRERRRKAKWLLVFALLCFSLILIYVISRFLGSFFVVGEVKISGDSPYTDSEIISAAGISFGDRLYRTDKKTAVRNITEKLPYIESVSIRIKLPSFVYITVSSERAAFYARISGSYYAVSGKMKVLERADTADRFEADGLLCIELPPVGSAVVGAELTLADGTDPGYIGTFVSAIEESELSGRISRLFMDERFDTVMSVDGRFRVRFGSDADVATKALAAARVIADGDLGDSWTVVIDVSDPSAIVTVRRDGLDLATKDG